MKRFSKILAVIEPEKTKATAIEQAISIANDHQADITFMSVIKETKSWRTAFGDKEEYLREIEGFSKSKRAAILKEVVAIAPVMNVNIVVASGIGFIEVIKRVINYKYDLVVKCAEDMDWVDRLLGSEDMHLLRKCPCPVLMLRPEHKGNFKKILATVDVNDDTDLEDARTQDLLNQKVLEHSAAMSIPELSEMHVGSIWGAYGEDFLRYSAFSDMPKEKVELYTRETERECRSKLDLLMSKLGVSIGNDAFDRLQAKTHLVKGEPSRDIPKLMQNLGVDLIVMGTVGRIGIPGLIIGNTAESILEQAQCSVLAVKPEGFKSPIE